MATTLEQYRQAKQDIQKLHSAARKELVTRFNELANELLLIQRELREEFGVKLVIPAKPRAGRSKAATTPPAKESGKSAERHAPEPKPEVIAVERKLAAQRRKLEEAIKAGKPDKLVRDRIYELEDELRLAKEP